MKECYDASLVEKAVLGEMIIDNSTIPMVVSQLDNTYFSPGHARNLFDIIKDQYEKGNPIDDIICSLEPGKVSATFISECTFNPSFYLDYHIQIIKNKMINRNIRKLLDETKNNIESNTYVSDVLDEVAKNIEQFKKQTQGQENIIDTNTWLNMVIDHIEQMRANKNDSKRLKTGFPSIDILLMDLEPSEFILLAGATSMGKTTMALNIARNIARSGNKVGMFVLESSAKKLGNRILCQECKLDKYEIVDIRNNGKFGKETSRIRNQYKIYMEECSGIKIDKLINDIFEMKLKKDIDIAIIDYIGLIQGFGNNAYEKTTSISNGLKEAAQKVKIPIIGLCQLSREVGKRTNKVPQLFDLRDSGSLEQDADKVIFLYRPNYYKKIDNNNCEDLVVIIAKNRDGRTGNVTLQMYMSYGLIKEKGNEKH